MSLVRPVGIEVFKEKFFCTQQRVFHTDTTSQFRIAPPEAPGMHLGLFATSKIFADIFFLGGHSFRFVLLKDLFLYCESITDVVLVGKNVGYMFGKQVDTLFSQDRKGKH